MLNVLFVNSSLVVEDVGGVYYSNALNLCFQIHLLLIL